MSQPLIASLRVIVGSEATDALLLDLLRKANNDVNAAANLYFTLMVDRVPEHPVPPNAAVRSSSGKMLTYHFKSGPIGLGLQDTVEGIKITDVTPGTQADRQSVPLLSSLIAIDGQSVSGLRVRDLTHLLAARSHRPIAMLIHHPDGVESIPPSSRPPPLQRALSSLSSLGGSARRLSGGASASPSSGGSRDSAALTPSSGELGRSRSWSVRSAFRRSASFGNRGSRWRSSGGAQGSFAALSDEDAANIANGAGATEEHAVGARRSTTIQADSAAPARSDPFPVRSPHPPEAAPPIYGNVSGTSFVHSFDGDGVDGSRAPAPTVPTAPLRRGFDLSHAPLQWQAVFAAVGFMPRDLADPECALQIVELLAATITDEQLAGLPTLPGVTEHIRRLRRVQQEQQQAAPAATSAGVGAGAGTSARAFVGGAARARVQPATDPPAATTEARTTPALIDETHKQRELQAMGFNAASAAAALSRASGDVAAALELLLAGTLAANAPAEQPRAAGGDIPADAATDYTLVDLSESASSGVARSAVEETPGAGTAPLTVAGVAVPVAVPMLDASDVRVFSPVMVSSQPPPGAPPPPLPPPPQPLSPAPSTNPFGVSATAAVTTVPTAVSAAVEARVVALQAELSEMQRQLESASSEGAARAAAAEASLRTQAEQLAMLQSRLSQQEAEAEAERCRAAELEARLRDAEAASQAPPTASLSPPPLPLGATSAVPPLPPPPPPLPAPPAPPKPAAGFTSSPTSSSSLSQQMACANLQEGGPSHGNLMSELMQGGRDRLRPASERPPTPPRARPPGSPGAPTLQEVLAAELTKAMARRRTSVAEAGAAASPMASPRPNQQDAPGAEPDNAPEWV